MAVLNEYTVNALRERLRTDGLSLQEAGAALAKLLDERDVLLASVMTIDVVATADIDTDRKVEGIHRTAANILDKAFPGYLSECCGEEEGTDEDPGVPPDPRVFAPESHVEEDDLLAVMFGAASEAEAEFLSAMFEGEPV